MERVWSVHQSLGVIPEDEGGRNSIHHHPEILVRPKPFNTLRVPTDLCRTCQIEILYYAPEGLIFRG